MAGNGSASLLQAIDECYACRELAEWPRAAMRSLLGMIDCDLVAFNDFDPAAGRYVAEVLPERPLPDGWEEAWALYGTQNASFRRLVEQGDVGPLRLSDLMTQRELHATELYRLVYRELGVNYQIATALEGPEPQVTAFALSRERRDFTKAELGQLRLIRPHLRRAYDSARSFAGLERDRAQLAAAAEAAGLRIVRLSSEGLVTDATPPAVAILARHLGGLDGEALPAPLQAWVERTLVAGTAASARLGTGAGVLAVSLVPGVGDALVILEEEDAAAASAALSPREREVLETIADGLTNAEAAARLGVSVRTIDKHLEHAYAKLGAGNRVAAIARYRRSKGG